MLLLLLLLLLPEPELEPAAAKRGKSLLTSGIDLICPISPIPGVGILVDDDVFLPVADEEGSSLPSRWWLWLASDDPVNLRRLAAGASLLVLVAEVVPS